jgi:hypothetical protein
MNLTPDGKEKPVYPCVIGLSFTFEGRQSTTLHLSDRRADPPPKRRR